MVFFLTYFTPLGSLVSVDMTGYPYHSSYNTGLTVSTHVGVNTGLSGLLQAENVYFAGVAWVILLFQWAIVTEKTLGGREER